MIQTDEINYCLSQSIEKFIKEFDSIFAKKKGKVDRITSEECYIHQQTTTQNTIHLRPYIYRTSVEDQEKIDEFIEEYRNTNVLQDFVTDQFGQPLNFIIDVKTLMEDSLFHCFSKQHLITVTI